MPQIRFLKKLSPIEVENGANLMRSLLDAGLPVASSCQGDGVCSKCKVRIVQGVENVSPISEDEKFLMERNNIPSEFRISCQVLVLGDVTVDTTYW